MLLENGDRIIFAGDSVTDMGREGDGEGIHEDVGRSYVRVIENLLQACYPEMSFRITNAGTSGNTSRDLLACGHGAWPPRTIGREIPGVHEV